MPVNNGHHARGSGTTSGLTLVWVGTRMHAEVVWGARRADLLASWLLPIHLGTMFYNHGLYLCYRKRESRGH
eukprot:360151-Chlamydomonas_euryale.AAC.3